MIEQVDQPLFIRKADITDSEDIWQWRNDEATRQMSIATDTVDWTVHSRWYSLSLENPDRYLYVGCINGTQKIGMCRFDVENSKGIAEVSINLNPSYRGRKLSTPLLLAAIQQFETERNVPLIATIRKKNTASIKCFTTLGFELQREDKEYNFYKRNISFSA